MYWRAPIRDANGAYTAACLADNNKMFDIISELFRDHKEKSYIKGARRTRDGRAAFLALHNHFLGPNNVDNQANACEAKLTTLSYTGEKRGWNFESYCRNLLEQFTILNNLTEHGHSGIDARSQVRRLNDGIRVKELDTVKATILATPNLRTDLEGCITLYRDFIAQSKTLSNSLNVSTVKTSGGGGDKGSGKGGNPKRRAGLDKFKDVHVEDIYYEPEAYRALSDAQKSKLNWLRSKRPDGKKPGGGDKGGGKRPQGLTKREIKAIAAATASKIKADPDASDDDSAARNSNTTNPALVRNKTKKRKTA